MVVAIIALFAAGASPQAAGDARALLQQVAGAFRTTASWHLEGEIITARGTESGMTTSAQPFQLYTRGTEMRYEVGGADATTVFRNGSTLWDYYVKTNSYARRDDMTGRYITGVLGWDVMAAGLMPTAVLAGRDQVQFEGHSQECQLVRSESRGTMRTLWIDRSRLLILRDREETTTGSGGQTRRSFRTVTYSRIERDGPMEESLFELPAGAVQRRAANGLPPGFIPAVAIVTTEPSYTPQARLMQRQGAVVVSADVGTDGAPHHVRVVRGLGLGLDERATEAVEKWHFKPAEQDGKPVAAKVTVVVSFQLESVER